jgi:hypothetical protein
VVGDVAAAVRSHQAQHALGDDEEVAVDPPQRDQFVDDAVELEPLLIVEAGDGVMKSKVMCLAPASSASFRPREYTPDCRIGCQRDCESST